MEHDTWYEVMKAAEERVAAGAREVFPDDRHAHRTVGFSYEDGYRDYVRLTSVKSRRGMMNEWGASADSRREAAARIQCGATVEDLDSHTADSCPACCVRSVLES